MIKVKGSYIDKKGVLRGWCPCGRLVTIGDLVCPVCSVTKDDAQLVWDEEENKDE